MPRRRKDDRKQCGPAIDRSADVHASPADGMRNEVIEV